MKMEVIGFYNVSSFPVVYFSITPAKSKKLMFPLTVTPDFFTVN